MELIPLLSMIILVATVSILVLAVCVYILYRIQAKKSDEHVNLNMAKERDEQLQPEDFGGRQLTIRKTEKPVNNVKHHKPIADSIVAQQKIDKTYQENERKKVKRKPTEPKYLVFNTDDNKEAKNNRNKSAISWR